MIRTHSGEVSLSKDFPGRYSAKVEQSAGIKLPCLLTARSVELFVNDGERVLFRPHLSSTGQRRHGNLCQGEWGKSFKSLTMWELNSVWK